jgi:putative restriction endonuclease
MVDSSGDTLLRSAAFERVRTLCEIHDHLTARQLGEGFIVDGQRYPLVNPRRGIFKPAQMRFLLSISTVFRKRATACGMMTNVMSTVRFSTAIRWRTMLSWATIQTPQTTVASRGLREPSPIIYFLAIAPGRYEAILPAFVGGWDRSSKRAHITFGLPGQNSLTPPATEIERRYALRTVKQRLHQASFREAVIGAYRGRCALSGFPESMLFDAADIVEDQHESLGHPVVRNGIPLSKIHHAAFDAHDYKTFRTKLKTLEAVDGAASNLSDPAPMASAAVLRHQPLALAAPPRS